LQLRTFTRVRRRYSSQLANYRIQSVVERDAQIRSGFQDGLLGVLDGTRGFVTTALLTNLQNDGAGGADDGGDDSADRPPTPGDVTQLIIAYLNSGIEDECRRNHRAQPNAQRPYPWAPPLLANHHLPRR
jgi:hypothetical protein